MLREIKYCFAEKAIKLHEDKCDLNHSQFVSFFLV